MEDDDDIVSTTLCPGSYVLCDKDIISKLSPKQLRELIQSQEPGCVKTASLVSGELLYETLDTPLFSSSDENK